MSTAKAETCKKHFRHAQCNKDQIKDHSSPGMINIWRWCFDKNNKGNMELCRRRERVRDQKTDSCCVLVQDLGPLKSFLGQICHNGSTRPVLFERICNVTKNHSLLLSKKSDSDICVKEKQRCLREKLRSCLLCHLCRLDLLIQMLERCDVRGFHILLDSYTSIWCEEYWWL